MASRVTLLLLLGLLTIAPPIAAQDRFDNADLIKGAESVDDAVERIKEVLEDQGFKTAIVIDHAANAAAAASVDLELPPTQVVMFRNPIADAFAIRRSQTIGIDLPLKLLVWEDTAGDIRVLYNSANFLAERHSIRTRDGLLALIDRVQGQFGDLENGLVTVESEQSVADTVDALQNALSAAGFRIPLVIDYKADAGFFSRGLRPTTLVVAGNPNVGTQLMQNSREVALNLPQKFLFWEDRHGEVNITYNDPAVIASRGGVQGLDTLIGNIADALANFADVAASGDK